jgi:hypothetical protein
LGILIPALVIVCAFFAVRWYLQRKKLKEEAEVAETRKNKKDKGLVVERKKVTEFEKTKTIKKMENEIMKEVEEIDKKYLE